MAMIHINRNRENIGKFNDQDVANGLRSGRFLPTDLAWREPMTTWEPLSSFTDLPQPEDEVTPVTAGSESLAPIDTDNKISIGECFAAGWESFQKNMGVLVMGTFIFLIVNVSLWFVSELAQGVMQVFMKNRGGEAQSLVGIAIAVGGFFSILTSILTTILSAGFLWMFIKNSRGKSELADMFKGFSSGVWLQIFLGGLAWGGLMLALAFVTLMPGFLLSESMNSNIPIALAGLVFIVPMSYFSVGMGFVLPLIVDRRIGWQEAMRTAIVTVHRQWFAVAGLVLVYTLLAVSGALICCVGILFTMPLGYAVWAECYRRLFGDPDSNHLD